MTETRRERRQARGLARDAWIESGGNLDACDGIFKAKAATAGLDPATILQLLIIAIKLWQWWANNRVSEPLSVAQSDEPFGDEDDAE